MTKLHLGVSVALVGALFWACSTTGESQLGFGAQGGASVFASGGNGSANGPSVGMGGMGPINTDAPKADAGYRRPKVCDATGQNCKCLNLLSLGATAKQAYGVGSDGQPSSTTAFETWLNEKSSAVVTMAKTRTTLTADYLAGFDVIILQDLTGWTFSADEKQALASWVAGGGGLITLSGYMNNDDVELGPTNDLMSFTGMSYMGGGVSGSVPGSTCGANSQQICPQSNSPCCYCWNNTMPITEWTTDHPIAKNIKAVGAFMGRQISGGDAVVVAKYEGKTVAASKTMESGKVFMWCDEWVTYTSQWAGGQKSGNPDQWNPCYNAATSQWLTADNALQTMQFWYNAIHYVSPPTECDFVINEEKVILL